MRVKIKFNKGIMVDPYTFTTKSMVGKVVEADYNPAGGYADVPDLELREAGAGDTVYHGVGGSWAFSDDDFEVISYE